MSHQEHLQKTRRFNTHQSCFRGTFAWLVALTLFLTAAEAWSMDCSPRIDAVSAARATGESADLAALPATGWEPVSLPDHWSQRWPNFTGTVWYRIDWARPCSANGDDRVPLGIVVEHLNMAGAVFINRELLWRAPSLVEPLSRSWNTPRFFPLGFSVLRTDHNELLIQVVGASDFSSGLGSVTISSAKDAAALYEKRMLLSRTLPGINVVISGTLGAFFLALWLMRRQDAAYGWYALTSATWVLFLSNTLVTSPWPFGTTDSWSRWITVSMVFFCVALCRFLWAFGGQRFPRLARALWIGSGLVALLFLLMPQSWFASATLVAFLTCVLIFVAICLQFIVRAVHTRTTEHLLLAACLLGFLVAGLHDAMLLLRILPANPAFTPVTAPLITIGMSLILASRFARSLKQVESFKVELEGQVRLARDARQLFHLPLKQLLPHSMVGGGVGVIGLVH